MKTPFVELKLSLTYSVLSEMSGKPIRHPPKSWSSISSNWRLSLKYVCGGGAKKPKKQLKFNLLSRRGLNISICEQLLYWEVLLKVLKWDQSRVCLYPEQTFNKPYL